MPFMNWCRSIWCNWNFQGMSVRTPPQITSIGTPSRNASPMPLAACVSPAAGTTTSMPTVDPIPLAAPVPNELQALPFQRATSWRLPCLPA